MRKGFGYAGTTHKHTYTHTYAAYIQGIENYFDKALGMLLLYKQERHAHQALVAAHPNTPASLLYGAEHLLRLIVKLPSLLQQVCIRVCMCMHVCLYTLHTLSTEQKASWCWWLGANCVHMYLCAGGVCTRQTQAVCRKQKRSIASRHAYVCVCVV
jgi:hypothetical protein